MRKPDVAYLLFVEIIINLSCGELFNRKETEVSQRAEQSVVGGVFQFNKMKIVPLLAFAKTFVSGIK